MGSQFAPSIMDVPWISNVRSPSKAFDDPRRVSFPASWYFCRGWRTAARDLKRDHLFGVEQDRGFGSFQERLSDLGV